MSITIQGRALAIDASLDSAAAVARAVAAHKADAAAPLADCTLDLDDPTWLDVPVPPTRHPPAIRRGPIRRPQPHREVGGAAAARAKA